MLIHINKSKKKTLNTCEASKQRGFSRFILGHCLHHHFSIYKDLYRKTTDSNFQTLIGRNHIQIGHNKEQSRSWSKLE